MQKENSLVDEYNIISHDIKMLKYLKNLKNPILTFMTTNEIMQISYLFRDKNWSEAEKFISLLLEKYL